MQGLSKAVSKLKAHIDIGRDLFGRSITTEYTDLIDVPGEHDYTPERLRYYKDGTRRYLQYGDDANYEETNTGHRLTPDPGQTLEVRSAERAAYPVGFDLLPSMSRRSAQAPQEGDVIAGGFGVLDIDNFDTATHTYADGSDADGWFWYHTPQTGLDSVLLAGVRDGTVYNKTAADLTKRADVLALYELQLNWYGVGPGVFRQFHTDIEHRPDDPFVRRRLGAVAADDGKSATRGSQRIAMAVRQAAGNDGLQCEVGSLSVKCSGDPNYQFKVKGHSMDLENTNTVRGTYQVCGAIRQDPTRPAVKVRVPSFEIISTPGDQVAWTRVLMIAVGAAETDVTFPADHADAVPVEHSAKNSVIEEVEDNTITGPVADDAGTDASGPTAANTMANPGGYQIGRESVTPEGTGAQSSVTRGQQVGNRNLYDGDVCLILVDSDTSGTVEIDVQTEQNS